MVPGTKPVDTFEAWTMRRADRRRQPKYARPGRGSANARRAAGKRMGLTAALFVAAVASALQVVMATHQLREIHGKLEETRNYQDLLLAEHSRLLIERGAQSAYHHVERLAARELNMQFPDDVERILP